VGYVAGGLALKAVHRTAFPTPRPLTPFVEVAHLAGRGLRNEIPPAIGPTFVAPQYSFDALFVVPQRLGAFPAVILPDQLRSDRFRAAMAVNPNADMPRPDFEQLVRYVTGGGRLLVLQEPQGDDGFVTNLLAFTREPRPLFKRTFTLPSLITNATAITNALMGSDPTTRTNSSNPIQAAPLPAGMMEAIKPRPVSWAAWSAQKGAVHVLSDSTVFSRAWIGNVMAEPSEPQRRAYELLFDVFRELLGNIERPTPNSESTSQRAR
jgi:hypothetical protein